MTLQSAETLSAGALFAALDATWPAAEERAFGPVTLRCGPGGGSRVTAARAAPDAPPEALAAAAQAMRARGRRPLFQLRPGEEAVDGHLASMGYRIKDQTLGFAAPVAIVAAEQPAGLGCLEADWPPLAVQREIWAEGGIGPGRLAIMDRARCHKVALLGRRGDRPAAVAFVAIHGTVAMLHALEVRGAHRRAGLGRAMMGGAARWARSAGASDLALLVTRANGGATALYAGLGMRTVTSYHYREAQEERP